ncbi:TIGR03943 family protein [Prauserella marina]|uniref:TIGR03943 family protein n=1 Tax=Prauserella marina TaxID=530584 RepID=A0A222VN91_9PSEU|nr:TIGR03943 family protein [Prauserella marina]ASR35191.1 TIGR03943 family protein [Prauserella marina]PWV85043.1 putative repeat protein (TIGR03943 family) [Prauserella marina]SDC06105.1 TIGR03943 family protein [Prauserella marina]
MRRETQNILLLLLGGALIKISLNGDYLRYVKPAHLPWLIAGGVVMVLLGGVAVVRDLVSAKAHHDGDEGHGGHDHPARAAWLLMVPVLAVFLVAPPALGSDSVTRSTADAPTEPGAAFPPLPGEDDVDVVPLSLSDFVSRAGWDETGSLNGRTVSLSGFVVQSEQNTLLARLVISCCAADAFPVRVALTGEQAAGLPDDTWIEVTGTLVPDGADGAGEAGYVPSFEVETLAEIPEPRDRYEY